MKYKAKSFIVSLFNKVKNNEIFSEDYCFAELTLEAMNILKNIEDELKSLLNTSDNASGLLAQRVYDFNSSPRAKVQHFLEFTKDFN